MPAKINDGLTCNQRHYRKYKTVRKKLNAERTKAWRHANPERARELTRQCYWRHAEDRRKSKSRQSKAKRARIGRTDMIRLLDRLYYHNRRRPGERIKVEDWLRLLEMYEGRCAYCGSDDRIEMDHVIPLSKGGRNVIENILPACKPCNASKCDSSGLPPRLRELNACG